MTQKTPRELDAPIVSITVNQHCWGQLLNPVNSHSSNSNGGNPFAGAFADSTSEKSEIS